MDDAEHLSGLPTAQPQLPPSRQESDVFEKGMWFDRERLLLANWHAYSLCLLLAACRALAIAKKMPSGS